MRLMVCCCGCCNAKADGVPPEADRPPSDFLLLPFAGGVVVNDEDDEDADGDGLGIIANGVVDPARAA